jgi:hypothetical protein
MSFPPIESISSANQPHSSQSSSSNPFGYPKSTSADHAANPGTHTAHDPPSIRSCVTCRRRKVRCNKRTPCSNCVKAGIECVFPPPGRAPRKSKRPQDAELLSRLRRLEGVIEHLSGKKPGAVEPLSSVSSPSQQETGPASPQEGRQTTPQTQSVQAGKCPFVLDSDPQAAKPRNLEHEFGRLVIDEGRSRYVSNRLWASLGDEVSILPESAIVCANAFGNRSRNFKIF